MFSVERGNGGVIRAQLASLELHKLRTEVNQTCIYLLENHGLE